MIHFWETTFTKNLFGKTQTAKKQLANNESKLEQLIAMTTG